MRSMFLLVPLAALAASCAVAVVPATVPFQGRLTDGAGKAVPDGPYNVRLSLYNGPVGPQSATETLQFTAETVSLGHVPVIVNSETVMKSDNSTTYTRNVAYTVNYATGVITRTSAATIPDGTMVTVTYQWTPTSGTASTRTVHAVSGVFATTLDLQPYNLTGEDWLQVEVDRGGVFEALLPRVRLSSVPYALTVASLDGAMGGTVKSSLGVEGSIYASSSVSGTGSSFMIGRYPVTIAGLQGTGATGDGGEAPGVVAVGVNNTGLALEARGRMHATGNLDVGGAASISGQMTSGGIQTGVILATGLSTTGSLPAVQAIHTDKDVATGNLYAQGEFIATRGMSGASLNVGTATVGTALTARNANVEDNLTADTASIRALNVSGAITGTGALKPDYIAQGSVWQAAGHLTQFITLPAGLQSPADLLIDVMEYSDSSGVRTYWSPQHLTWNTTVTNNLAVGLSSTNPGSGTIYFRVRVWKTR